MRKPAAAKTSPGPAPANPYDMVPPAAADRAAAPMVHQISRGVVCNTDTKGFAMPNNRSPAEIVVDASNGFIPLWANDVTLRWRFQEQSMTVFKNPNAAKQEIKNLFGEAVLAWGDAAPVKFAQRDDAWDFEIVMMPADDCNSSGSCVLAKAFFPDAGRHELLLYPKMFTQPRNEQVETLAHEIGHIFGLRHFFAVLNEQAWPSEIFGVHERFSIMNYGDESVMTDNDRLDLKHLYTAARSGQMNNINGTPIKLVQPFSAVTSNPFVMSLAVAASTTRTACRCCCCRNHPQ